MFQKSWYMAGRSLVDLFMQSILKPDIHWEAPLPAGPKIIAVNHPSTGDPAFVTTLIEEQSSILILDAVFRVPVFGPSLKWAGHVPVIPGSGKAALEEAARLLKAGRTIVIFPEGVISTPGSFNKFHTGAARLALSTGIPVIPIGISLDSTRIRLMDAKIENHDDPMAWYLHGPYAITVGKAMTFEGNADDHDCVQHITEQIKQGVIALSKAGNYRLSHTQAAQQRPAGWKPNVFSRAGNWAARSVGVRIVQTAMFLFMMFGKHYS